MSYLVHILTMAAVQAISSIGLNLVVGYTGLVSIAQAAFVGIGAYGFAIFLTKFGFTFFPALISSIAISATAALFMGLILSRFSVDFYILGSVGFNIIVTSIFLSMESLTRGPLGIVGIPRPLPLFNENVFFLLLVLIFLALAIFAARFIVHSSFGRVLKAIREDEKVIQIFGYQTQYFKLMVFVVGTSLGALIGALYASYISYIDYQPFTVYESVVAISVVILGGLASIRGSVAGAVIMVIIPELLRFVGLPAEAAAQLRQVFYGLILILLMLYNPKGIWGEYKL